MGGAGLGAASVLVASSAEKIVERLSLVASLVVGPRHPHEELARCGFLGGL